MSSDEESERLRSSLIKSIRSNKTTRARSSTFSKSPSKIQGSGKARMSSDVLDTDMDDLEALRRAALGTLKKTKINVMDNQVDSTPFQYPPSFQSIAQYSSSATYPPGTYPPPPPGVVSTFAPGQQQHPPHPFFVHQPPPPILMGPSSSMSQYPAPPPMYQPRFFGQNLSSYPPPSMSVPPPFRPMMPAPVFAAMRSNLIVIQPLPRPEDQTQLLQQHDSHRPNNITAQSSTASNNFSSGKLVLPQDRYARRNVADGIEEEGNKRKNDKWSRFDDKASDSESSSDDEVSIVSSDDDENDSDRDGEDAQNQSGETQGQDGSPMDEDGQTQDSSFEVVIIDETTESSAQSSENEDENIGDDQSRNEDDDAKSPTADRTEINNDAMEKSNERSVETISRENSFEMEKHERPATPPAPSPPRPRVQQSYEDELLLGFDEPDIEFLDEPADDELIQRLVDSPLALSTESAPTPEIRQQQQRQTDDMDDPKEFKKRQLASEYVSLKQQLDELHQQKKSSSGGGSQHRSSDDSHRRRYGRDDKDDQYRRSRSNSRITDERASRRRDDERASRKRDSDNDSRGKRGDSRRREDEHRDHQRRHHHRSPPSATQNRPLLSSVVAVSSSGGGDHSRSGRSEAKRENVSDIDGKRDFKERRGGQDRGHSSDGSVDRKQHHRNHRLGTKCDSDDARRGSSAIGGGGEPRRDLSRDIKRPDNAIPESKHRTTTPIEEPVSVESPKKVESKPVVLLLPSAGEDLRKFLIKKKDQAVEAATPSNNNKPSNDPEAKRESSASAILPAKGGGKVKKSILAAFDSEPSSSSKLANGSGDIDGGSESVHAATIVTKVSIKDRLSLPRGDKNVSQSGNGGGGISRRWKTSSGATGSDNTGAGKKVQLRKRPY